MLWFPADFDPAYYQLATTLKLIADSKIFIGVNDFVYDHEQEKLLCACVLSLLILNQFTVF